MLEPVTLMPHAVCWAAAPRLVWTMVVTNFITFLSYLSICLTLLFLSRRTGKVIVRDWAWFLVGFALFIVACGSTHLLEVITTWDPIFWVDAGTNVVTALLSAYVAIQLIRRAGKIAFGINDYAARLGDAENEKRRMEESLLAAQKLEDWSRMSAVVAHEINNPLEAIHNLLYLIRSDQQASADTVKLAQAASDEASRVMTITRSTLSFFRQTLEPEEIDLGVATESVSFLLDPLVRSKRIHLATSVGQDTVVEAFPGEARQVLLNLVRNACEAVPEETGQVRVTVVGKSDSVMVVVVDNGIGIAPERLPKLFEFGVTTKGERGNGMGLWTAKHIVTRHGGQISVESTLGGGTRFELFWPRDFRGTAAMALPVAHAV